MTPDAKGACIMTELMKLHYVRTNAYDMLIADHGDHRHFVTDFGFFPSNEDEAKNYLTENANDLVYNSHEWEETEETVEELTNWQGTEILAEIEAIEEA